MRVLFIFGCKGCRILQLRRSNVIRIHMLLQWLLPVWMDIYRMCPIIYPCQRNKKSDNTKKQRMANIHFHQTVSRPQNKIKFVLPPFSIPFQEINDIDVLQWGEKKMLEVSKKLLFQWRLLERLQKRLEVSHKSFL